MTPLQLRAARRSYALTGEKMAEQLGVSLRTYRAYEMGESSIPKAIDLLLRLADEVPIVRMRMGLQKRQDLLIDRGRGSTRLDL